MFPFHLRLGPLSLGLDQLFMLLGLVVGFLLIRRRLQGLGIFAGDWIDLFLAVLLSGAVGAKLFYLLPLWIRGVHSLGYLLKHWSEGSGFYGAVLGGLAGAVFVLKKKQVPVLKALDPIGMAVPIGFAFGKLGCFLAGCCYGSVSDWPPGVRFPAGSVAFETQRAAGQLLPGATTSRPVHPAQLYELTFSVALFGFLWWLYRRSKAPGETFFAWMLVYSAWRFGIEFLRADPGRHVFGVQSLSDSQIVAAILVPVALVSWIAVRRRFRAESGKLIADSGLSKPAGQ